MSSIRKGFTLMELMVVIAMIGIIMGAIVTSTAAARERARREKALSEVKTITQAILAYENVSKDEGLPTMENRDADSGSLGFITGRGGESRFGGKIGSMLDAVYRKGGKLTDPWGTPYKITIRSAGASIKIGSASGTMQTGYYFPNYYRLSEEERQ
ncbi:MAG: prepilin-type N-terminal cleavage/methylation domain-containing protein [Kiritimatiellia bacterium]